MSQSNSKALPNSFEMWFAKPRAWFEHNLMPGADANRLLARASLLEEQRPSRVSGATTTIVSALVLGFLGWSAVMRLDEITAAPGQITPESFVQPVQHLEGGIVAKVLVQDGTKVKAGQPLVILQEAAFGAELDQLRARQATLMLQAERLRALSEGRPARFDQVVQGYESLKRDQTSVLRSQRDALDMQLSVLSEQTSEARASSSAIDARRASARQELDLAREQLAVRQELFDKGLSSKLALLNAKRDVERLEGELGQARAEFGRTTANIAEARQRGHEAKSRLIADAQIELGQVTGELAQVDEQLRRSEDRVKRLALTAPIDGVVKGLAAHSVGAVVPPGATLAEIVPSQAGVVAEVRVAPQDIGHIQVGMPANVKISTYDFSRYGGVAGHVQYVSASSFMDEQGRPYFKVRVALDQDHIGAVSAGRKVTSGMTLVADIKTGNKSLLAYLARPVTNALDSGFTER